MQVKLLVPNYMHLPYHAAEYKSCLPPHPFSKCLLRAGILKQQKVGVFSFLENSLALNTSSQEVRSI